jgi:hypothetical protein
MAGTSAALAVLIRVRMREAYWPLASARKQSIIDARA